MSQTAFDPLALEVMAHAFAGIAEEMGTVLVRGALSPNIRERRDSSAALFDAEGRMIAQAAHIPVHLGAMPEAVRAVRAARPRPRDVFLLNDPYHGGSHLPDLTLVEAISLESRIVGYGAVRAHHADVGGMSPGSMPQGATELVQEGLVLPPVRIVREGVVDEELLAMVLANVRTPEERRGDLRAQLAACTAGVAGPRPRGAHRPHRFRHRAEVNGDVRRLRDHAPLRVEQRGGRIAPLADVRRERAAHEHGAHLLRDPREGVRHDLEREGIERGLGHASRSRSQPPIGSARAVHPSATRSVASGSAITARPRTVTSSSAPVSSIAVVHVFMRLRSASR